MCISHTHPHTHTHTQKHTHTHKHTHTNTHTHVLYVYTDELGCVSVHDIVPGVPDERESAVHGL